METLKLYQHGLKSIENLCNLDTVRKIKRYAKINSEWNHIVNLKPSLYQHESFDAIVPQQRFAL